MPRYSRPRYKPGRHVHRPVNYVKCHPVPVRDPKRTFTVADAGRIICRVMIEQRVSREQIIAEAERRCPDESKERKVESAAAEIAAALANISANNLLLGSVEGLLLATLALLGIVVAIGRLFAPARFLSIPATLIRSQVQVLLTRTIVQRAANDALFNRLVDALRRAA